ncbi:MAG TPA: single-stranded-DNA-specific exonuclease RecJ, partial [Pseudoxanthomonas sp.]|nr:single-stranded-DNA-specific exonuclease RecJ [Pseudoxanthomonas sp.]
LRMQLRHPGRREPLAAIRFGGWQGREPPARLRLAYRLVPDDYRGGQAVQLTVEHFEPA